METISLNINGVCRELAVGKNWTLLKTLRDGLKLTGTKCGCETGDCGACMVIIDGVATRSCLVKAVNLEGKAIETIEGLSDGIHLHPILKGGFEGPPVSIRTEAETNTYTTEESVFSHPPPAIFRHQADYYRERTRILMLLHIGQYGHDD